MDAPVITFSTPQWESLFAYLWEAKPQSSWPAIVDALLAASPDFISIHDRAGRYLYINETGAKTLGRPAEEILGRHLTELGFSAEQIAPMRQAREAVFATGRPFFGKITLVVGERLRAYEYTFSPIYSSRGEIEAMLGITRDVTARDENETQLRLALEAARMGVWNFHVPSGRLTYSAELGPRLGLARGDSYPDYPAFLTAVHPDDRDRLIRAVERALWERADYELEFRILWPDGSIHWLASQGKVCYDADGQPFQMVGVAIDIDARKRAEEMMARQNAILAMIAQGKPRAQTLDAIVWLMEQLLPGAICSLLLLEEDGRTLRHGAAPRLPRTYCRAIDGVQIGPAVGSCGTAAYRRKPVIVRDIAASPLWADYRDLALRHGLRACWSMPILAEDGCVLGTFAIYFTTPRAPTAEELKLIMTPTYLTKIALTRYRAEEEQARLIGQMQGVFDSIAEGLIVCDPEGRIVAQNAAARRMVWPADSDREYATLCEVAERTEHLTLDGTPLPVAEWPISRALRGETIQDCELLMRHKAMDAQRIGCYSATPVRDKDGKIVLGISSVRDVTAQKEAEIRLRASEQRYRQLTETMRDLVTLQDLHGTILYVSPLCLEMLGYAPEEMVGHPGREFVHPDDLARNREEALRSLETGSGECIEWRCRRKDGAYIWLETSLAFCPDAEGKPEYLLSVSRDITERKRLEEQFLQAQKMEGIGRLAGGIAHDFNNLLSIIQGYAELVEMELTADSDLLAKVQNIQDAATRAARLTSQLLAFARRQVTTPKVFSPNEMLAKMTAMLAPLIGEQITFTTQFAPEVGSVRIDPSQLEQIVVNLVINARDAMPEGGTLRLQTEAVTLDVPTLREQALLPSGSYIVLSVSDTGMGMTEEVRKRAFEPFFTTKGGGKGTGLGLATCYGIVKQNGGYIWIESEEGRGTTVLVYLPRVEGASAPVPAQTSVEALLPGTETVLVAEDEPSVRALVVSTLQKSGYTVLEAGNGAEALQIAADYAGEIHLLVTDVIMPQMGGRELAERLRQARPGVRILFASGYTEDAFPEWEALPHEAVFLQKPFNAGSLLYKAREALSPAAPVSSR
jgi:PAS domain S-box-containing protein